MFSTVWHSRISLAEFTLTVNLLSCLFVLVCQCAVWFVHLSLSMRCLVCSSQSVNVQSGLFIMYSLVCSSQSVNMQFGLFISVCQCAVWFVHLSLSVYSLVCSSLSVSVQSGLFTSVCQCTVWFVHLSLSVYSLVCSFLSVSVQSVVSAEPIVSSSSEGREVQSLTLSIKHCAGMCHE